MHVDQPLRDTQNGVWKHWEVLKTQQTHRVSFFRLSHIFMWVFVGILLSNFRFNINAIQTLISRFGNLCVDKKSNKTGEIIEPRAPSSIMSAWERDWRNVSTWKQWVFYMRCQGHETVKIWNRVHVIVYSSYLWANTWVTVYVAKKEKK